MFKNREEKVGREKEREGRERERERERGRERECCKSEVRK